MRVPVAAFAIDGTPEVVQDGRTGRLIGLGALERFGDTLLDLASDAGLRARMGAAGRALCLERFDWRRMVGDLERLYQSLPA